MKRQRPPGDSDERTQLSGWLDWYRATVRMKCEGVGDAAAHRAMLPSSPLMTMAGVVSHLRWVEYGWFETNLLARPEGSSWDETRVSGVPLRQLLDEYDAQCARSREIADAHSLDMREQVEPAPKDPASLRWIMHHMIEETARHCGHLDAIRELTDGVTGY